LRDSGVNSRCFGRIAGGSFFEIIAKLCVFVMGDGWVRGQAGVSSKFENERKQVIMCMGNAMS